MFEIKIYDMLWLVDKKWFYTYKHNIKASCQLVKNSHDQGR